MPNGEKETREKILGLIGSHDGLTISDVSRMLNIHYTTASKYLSVLEAERHIAHRQIGMAKLFSTNHNNGVDKQSDNRNLDLGKFFVVFLLLAVGLSTITFALPNKIPINGRLTFSNDTDINGTANFIFKIYNNKTGGSLLWQETQGNLNVRRGLLSTYLGNNTPISLSFDENYFLEIVVNGETVEPRFDFGTNGYSFTSNQTIYTKNDTKALGNITPVTNNTNVLGSSSVFWLAGYFTNLFVQRDLNVTGNIFTGNIFANGAPVALQSNITSLSNAQSSDNTTQGNLATGNYNTLFDKINTKVNQSNTSATCSGTDKVTNVTVDNGKVSILCGIDQTVGSSASDNTTLTGLITGNNNTLGSRITTLENDNITQDALISLRMLTTAWTSENTTIGNLYHTEASLSWLRRIPSGY